MPRLTNTKYADQRSFLRWVWLNCDGFYGELTGNEQHAIHAFYQPSRDLTFEQLASHRRVLSIEQPNLPAAAGKAAHRLYRFVKAEKLKQETRGTQPELKPTGPRQIRVRAVRRPEVDVKQLSRAFMQLAEHQAREEAAARELR